MRWVTGKKIPNKIHALEVKGQVTRCFDFSTFETPLFSLYHSPNRFVVVWIVSGGNTRLFQHSVAHHEVNP